MATITSTTATSTTVAASPSTDVRVRRHPVRRATLLSGLIAAVSVATVAATAHAAGVPLAIEGEMIPIAGFAQMALLGAVLGGIIAALVNRYSARSRHRFLVTCCVLTALSCIPSVALPPDVATKIVLVFTHVLAAAIVVPALARRTRP